MERAEEFMDLYLREKSRLAQVQHCLGRRFETRFWAPEYRRLYLDRRELKAQSPETVLNVEESANDAQVITTGRPGCWTMRFWPEHLKARSHPFRTGKISSGRPPLEPVVRVIVRPAFPAVPRQRRTCTICCPVAWCTMKRRSSRSSTGLAGRTASRVARR